MTAVASPPSFEQINRSAWGASGGPALNSMNGDEVSRMFMPRKSAQRANSSSSTSSNSSSTSTATVQQSTPQTNGTPVPVAGDGAAWNGAAARKKPQRTGPWPNKAEPVSSTTAARPQSILATNGVSAASTMTSLQQPSPVVPSQHLQAPSQQQNGTRQAPPPIGDANPVLYLLSMNGTFERKTIQVPYYPDSLRIGRQTNAKTVPTPSNGFFDSKVLSRQHAEIWADRNGKVWIRDVRSSNGTFVNGARLSAENRDSEPHELQSQDHLELGIDIVSEDQKTVVHHKVAAKVEHAGFLGATTNVLDMNFGDLDPANGSLMLPSQNSMQLRGRTSSQGSIASNRSFGPPGSVAPSNMSMGQQRTMNFWLTPVTTEQIVKRLTHEMRTARLQSNDLVRAESFLGTLLSKEELKVAEKVEKVDKVEKIVNEVKPPQVNGPVAFKIDAKPRFSDPPAPPPQQPLPEKPDVIRSHPFDPTSPSLKRSSTERPRSVPNVSPSRPESTSQILSLVEALASAKKEIDAQNDRMRDLEDMLQKEREARESAEGRAKRLELESIGINMNGFAKSGVEGSVVEEAFNPPAELNAMETKSSPEAVEASTTQLQEKLELMMIEMREMKEHMETFRHRAETAETERDSDRKTLAEMVEKIRSDEHARRSSSTQRARSPVESSENIDSKPLNATDESAPSSPPLLENFALRNGAISATSGEGSVESPLAIALTRPPGNPDHLLYHSTPYASMLGVVLIGMGLMAYMNGWKKVER